MPLDGPPAHAWDWLARQRFVWREARRRLVAAGYGQAPTETPTATNAAPAMRQRTDTRAGDVPDWSADHPELLVSGTSTTPPSTLADDTVTGRDAGRRDYAALDTRGECIAALRADYPEDATLRTTVDAVVADLAFLGRLDVPLHELGVRTAPRGMRWWWTHLTGRDADEGRSEPCDGDEHPSSVPLQLRLVDVLAGYGDVTDV
jgi:hypothetical protein